MPGIDLQARNKQGQTPSDSVVSKKFSFDHRSIEHDITVLFHDTEAGFTSTPPVSQLGGSGLGLLQSEARSSGTGGTEGQQEGRVQGQHLVPLLTVPQVDEEAFMAHFHSGSLQASDALACEPGPVCGVSSFMLSAGLGALSKVFLAIIQEEDITESGSHIAQDDAPLQEVSLHDFKVISSLGKGSFGRVELVEHRDTKEQFAMKLLERQKYAAQRITRFAFSEQYILKTTRHPLIVSLHFAFQTSRHWVLVMEYCHGGNLMERLIADGSPGLTPALCARVGGEILLALEHLHRIHVIFRDVKPENIVFDAQGRAKVTDFGLAKKLGPDEKAFTACGTEGYAAPELITRTGKYSFAVDIYSYGILMYVILSGGHASSREPSKRLPPQTHASFRTKLYSLPTPAPTWALATGALSLLQDLTKGQPTTRPSAPEAKEHHFFTYNLGHAVDELLPDF